MKIFEYPTGNSYTDDNFHEYAFIFKTGGIRWTIPPEKVPGNDLLRIEHDLDGLRCNIRESIFNGTEQEKQSKLILLCEDLSFPVLTQVLAEDTTDDRLNYIVNYYFREV